MSIKSWVDEIADLPNKLPLRIVLIVPLMLLLTGTVGIVGYLSFRNGQKAVNDVATQLRNEIVRQIEEKLNISTKAAHTVNRLNAIAFARGDISIADARGEQNFWQQVEIFPTVTFIFCSDVKDNVLGAGKIGGRKLQSWVSNSSTRYIPYYYSLDPKGNRTQELEKDTQPFNPRVRPWYKAAVAAGKPTWSDIYLVVPTFDPAVAASLPVYDLQTRKLIGVCATDIFLPQQMSQFLKSLNVGKTGHVFIMERSGRLVATSANEPMTIGQGDNTRRLLAAQSSNSIIQATAQQLSDRFGDFNRIQTSEQFDFNIHNNRQLAEVTPFKDGYGLDWLIVTVIPEADYLGQIQANIRNTLALCVVALIAGFILCVLIARWITKPVLSLNQSAKAIATGEWNQIAHIKRSDELGELANSFNVMAHRLQKAFDELQTLNQTLAQNETRLQEFLEAIPVGIAVVDASGRPYYANQRGIQLLGQGIDPSVLPAQITEVYQLYLQGTNQPYPTERMPIVRALKGERSTVDDMEIHQNNATIPIEVRGTPIFDQQGNVIYAIAAFQDITERRQTEKLLADYNRTLEQQVVEQTTALRESEAAIRTREQELRLLADALPVCIFYTDSDQRYRFVNHACEIWYNRSRDEIVGRLTQEVLGEAHQGIEQYIQQALAGHTTTYETELSYPSGNKHISAIYIPDFDRNGQVKGYYGLISDISDRKRAEAASILEERNRMAREIHDTLAQAFTGILVQADGANQVLMDDIEAAQSHLEMIDELARTGLSEARRSVSALRPQLLEDGDLSGALQRLVTQMRSVTDTALIYDVQGTTYSLPGEVENNLLRIGQEALTNAIKYAHAQEIRMELVYDNTCCRLRVTDDGQGFGVGSVPGSGGFGLLGMSERAAHVGAQLSIRSQPGQGTEIVVTLNRAGEL